ncbi:MAG: type I methionyl aminopeptidase [Dorea sp. 42_8]|nr:MAG: type I methionyl aminopeptidase [Dorea sp. 42_8]
MAITIKSEREIELMAEAGKILERVHNELEKALRPGMSTKDIDTLGEEIIRSYGCIPSFLNYNGYPAQEGDIVSLDAGVIYKGYHSDAARTHAVGEVSEEAKKLIRVTEESFFEGIKFAKAGNHLFDISGAIGRYAEERGYGVVRDLCGHGIGTALHEAPEIPNYEVGRKGVRLRPGMTLAIEPMINIGTHEVDWLDDDWTVVTRDGSLSAHYENTILITEGEPRILSLTCENE